MCSLVTLALSLLCGVLFGLAPALQATRPALMPRLRDRSRQRVAGAAARRVPRLSLTQALVVAQIAISLLLLVAAGLFVRTLSNLQSISLGFNRDNVLLFELNAPQAGYPEARVADFYADLRRRLSELPGVRDATLSHASLIRAGRSHPITVDGAADAGHASPVDGTPVLHDHADPDRCGAGRSRNSDREGTLPVAVVSDLFARTNFGEADPIGRRIADRRQPEGRRRAARPRDRRGRRQCSIRRAQGRHSRRSSTCRTRRFRLRSWADDVRAAHRRRSAALRRAVRQIVHEADGRVPVTNLRTQAADIDQTINQEIVFARLCSAFAILALMIACVGLYATMAYAVARRTSEIGLRMALGAGRGAVIWMVLRDVCVLAAVGLAIGVPTALAASRLIESFLFETKPNDPRALALAAAILLIAALVAGYGPARRASRVDPMVALRHE